MTENRFNLYFVNLSGGKISVSPPTLPALVLKFNYQSHPTPHISQNTKPFYKCHDRKDYTGNIKFSLHLVLIKIYNNITKYIYNSGSKGKFSTHSPQCCHNLPLISEEELFCSIPQKTNCEHRSGFNLPPWFQTKLMFLFLCLKAVIVTSLKPICTIQVQDKRSNEIFTQTLQLVSVLLALHI